MYEQIDELIELNLKRMLDNEYAEFYWHDFRDLGGDQIPKNLLDILIREMVNNDLITTEGEVSKLTIKGHDIAESGWQNHLDFKKRKEVDKFLKQKEIDKQNESRRKAELESLHWNTKLTRFQVKSRYWPHILSVLSFGLALAAFFREDKTGTPQLSQDEVIHIIDSISTSNQTKKVDSMPISKTVSDSLPDE